MEYSILEHALLYYARKCPIRRGKLRLVNALWRAASGARSTHRTAVLNHGGFEMSCDLSEMLQRQFYFFGTYFVEEDILGSWAIAAGDAEVVFDVGANAGIFGLAAIAARPAVTVHAFEPTPEIAARLRATVKRNRLARLHVHEVAVSNQNGQAVLCRCRGDLGTNEGMNFVASHSGDSNAECVRTICLDQFCREYALEKIDLLKLDIQGHEHVALAGAEAMLGAGRITTIFIELNWSEEGQLPCPATESIRLLDQAGYLFSRPGRHLKWRRAGDWMRAMNDAIARYPNAGSNRR